ncbi:MAG: von Willebrand factor type A domain-containing protein [Ruminococcus sp.]|nr:von Willebrand factor type A domain-containing protein [Ruminococcus sp.]
MKKSIKKVTALVTALTLTMGTLASCGSEKEKSSKPASTSQTGTAATEDTPSAEPEENYDRSKSDTLNTLDGAEIQTYATEAEAFYDDAADFDMYTGGTEEYDDAGENEYTLVADEPLSTFSTDVDTASYTTLRRMIGQGYYEPAAVRTEEFLNYFHYDFPFPENDDKLAICTELTDCPWNSSAQLLMIGLQAQDIEVTDVPSNIVFLIDVSGSMESEDKLPLVREAFSLLSDNLGPQDRVSIVTYAGEDSVVLTGESGANTDVITDALNNLTAGGSTAGAAGINTAYDIAQQYFIEGGNNRVILATDGDLNVGPSSTEELTDLITEKREQGIFLSVLGFGMGNYKDNRLEALADNGNGNYAYIDNLDEARRVLVTEMNGTLFTVAKDAKVQVEFNPLNVSGYRLVGYENRIIASEDFEDDEKDGGEIGAAQQVTVLYEIIPNDGTEVPVKERTLKYQEDIRYPSAEEQTVESPYANELLTVSVRYKERDENESKLIEKAVTKDSYIDFGSSSDNMTVACAATMFAGLLRESEITGVKSAEEILSFCSERALPEQYSELTDLIQLFIDNAPEKYDYETYYDYDYDILY